MNFFGVSLDSMSVCLDGNLCGLREDLRNWLLATAGINPAVIERLVATLDEEEVESLDDLRKFAGAAGGRFLDARLTVTTARKIQNGLRGTPVLGAAPTPTPMRLPPSVGRLKPTADARNVVGPTWVR